MLELPNFRDWFWIVGEDNERVYSSRMNSYVATNHFDFVTWLEKHPMATIIKDEADLLQVLKQQGIDIPEWQFDGEYFLPRQDGTFRPLQLLAYAKAKRKEIELGGISFDGMTIETDDRTKTMLMGARIKANSDPSFKTPWAGPSGIVELDAAQIIALSEAVLDHVQSVFVTFAAVVGRILLPSPTITTTEQIDAEFAG